MLGMMIQTVLNHNIEVAAAQDQAVAAATERINNRLELIMETMSIALSSSVALREQLVSRHWHRVYCQSNWIIECTAN